MSLSWRSALSKGAWRGRVVWSEPAWRREEKAISCTCIFLAIWRKERAALSLQQGISMATYTIVTIVGSLRKESFSLKIANALAKLAPA